MGEGGGARYPGGQEFDSIKPPQEDVMALGIITDKEAPGGRLGPRKRRNGTARSRLGWNGAWASAITAYEGQKKARETLHGERDAAVSRAAV